MKWTMSILLVLSVLAAAAETPVDVGKDRCRTCHRSEYETWTTTAHASALDRLSAADRSRPECLACHATDGSADLPGVQCEACHGPGSLYRSLKVMRNRVSSLAAGLVLPEPSGCLRCHLGAPHRLPAFDPAASGTTGIHALTGPWPGRVPR